MIAAMTSTISMRSSSAIFSGWKASFISAPRSSKSAMMPRAARKAQSQHVLRILFEGAAALEFRPWLSRRMTPRRRADGSRDVDIGDGAGVVERLVEVDAFLMRIGDQVEEEHLQIVSFAQRLAVVSDRVVLDRACGFQSVIESRHVR